MLFPVWLRRPKRRACTQTLMAMHGSGRLQGHQQLSYWPAPLPPIHTHTHSAIPDLAPLPVGAVGHGGHRAQWGSAYLQSRPELKGLSVSRPLLHHVHLRLNALLGIECDPVLLPVIYLHRRQQRRKESSEGHTRAEGGAPKWKGLIVTDTTTGTGVKGWELVGQHGSSCMWWDLRACPRNSGKQGDPSQCRATGSTLKSSRTSSFHLYSQRSMEARAG